MNINSSAEITGGQSKITWQRNLILPPISPQKLNIGSPSVFSTKDGEKTEAAI
jgi:hypothetical protein